VAELQTLNAQIEETLAQTRAELEEVRLKREMEQATQAELEKQLKDLNGEVSRLKEELNFFKKTKKQPS
jgi:septal ring factor EnvC (AmiA/AmiB activator)